MRSNNKDLWRKKVAHPHFKRERFEWGWNHLLGKNLMYLLESRNKWMMLDKESSLIDSVIGTIQPHGNSAIK